MRSHITPALGRQHPGERALRIAYNLPDDFIGDFWGGRFTYAVTEALATDGTYNRDEGAIFIRDSNDNDMVVDPVDGPGTAHYVVLSHGANDSGATSLAGAGAAPCTAGTLEAENCDGDAVFRSTILAGTANNANLYDDPLIFRATTTFGDQVPAGAVMAFNLNACPDGWVPFGAGDARFFVGADGVNYDVGDTGGMDTVALTEPEIGFQASGNPINPAAVPGPVVFAQDIGAAMSHENRPPYIALLYCEKS